MRFRERLSPSPWTFVACSLLVPAGLLVFLPISLPVAIAAAIVFFVGAAGALLLLSPTIEVTGEVVRAGRAQLPLAMVGTVSAHRGAEATAERGPRLDARAYLCIRGWIDPVVRVEVDDPRDPTPYWIVSTRRPDELVAALEAARA